MAKLTNIQQTLAFDANKELKTQIDKLMTAAGTKGLCIPIAAAYLELVSVVNTAIVPVAHMKKQIVDALNDNPVVDAMETASEVLNVINTGLGKVNFQIDPATLKALNIFSKICLNFNELLPKEMKEYICEVLGIEQESFEDFFDYTNEDNIRKISDEFGGMFTLPDFLVGSIEGLLEDFAGKALSEGFDDLTKIILSPLEQYREFLKSSGILKMIRVLQKYERCMTNPNTCNRPRHEFYFPGTKKYNSQYYLDLLAVNLKGEIQLKKLNNQFETFEGNVYKVLKKIDDFKGNIIKPK